MNTLATGKAPALLTADDVAVLLSLSRRTVMRLSASGRLPGRVKIGSSVRWRKDAIERWLAADCPPVREPRKRPRVK